MKARVTGGTYNGGTVVLIERDNGYECEVEQSARGVLRLRLKMGDPPSTLEEVLRIEIAAREAINNYDGPSDADLAAWNDQPSAAEQRELDARDAWRVR